MQESENIQHIAENDYGRRFENETATNFFHEFLSAYRLAPDYDRVYEEYGRTFSKLLFQSTEMAGVKFSGNFARTSYLLKENDATPHQMRMINDARVRIRKSMTLGEEDKAANHAYDFMALQTFVSIIYHTDIPGDISVLFPGEREEEQPAVSITGYYRMIVDSFDDDYICGRSDSEGFPEVRVAYKGGSYNFDNTYIREILYKGAQLNVINPHEKDGVVYPDLIIFEPDMLTDVTAVASCFQDYGTSPLISLVNKLKTVADTPAIVLGNLAGQFLDEEVNYRPDENTFVKSICEFYSRNPLSLITSDVAADAKDFFDKARQQKINIHRAIRSALPHSVGRFKPEEVILEPSFISEMLGLQGRMDFLQLDKKVVIEQKSGKCGFPQHHPDIPVGKLQHYVQVLLYMLVLRYNYSEEYKKNKGLQAFLLYSRYPESLLALDFAPSLIHEAIKVRNLMTAAEYRHASEGFGELDTMVAGDLLENQSKAKFFHAYIEPSINGILSPIQKASKLERAYFYRFMKFVAEEHILSKIGNRTKANSGFASAWNDSLDEKLQAGNIYCDLTLGDMPLTDGKIETVTMNINGEADNDMSNFRPGDIVMLYPYAEGCEPDARRTILFRCTIAEIKVDKIILKLRAPQSDANVFTYHDYYRWAVEHDFMESSYAPLYRGIHSMLTAPEERRRLILMQRSPETDETQTLKGDYGTFNELMLKVKQARDMFLILGPPGTGKTSFGMLNTLKEQLLEPDTSVLLLSYTNRAVDEICSKLVQADIDFVRVGSSLSCSEEYTKYLISERVRQYPKLNDMRAMLEQTRVYVGTVTALNGNLSLFGLKTFQLAIIDEASQILEPHLMPLLCATNAQGCAIRKFVMIGDHKQLPAVVQQTRNESVVTDEILNDIGLTDCRNSLFQRFYEAYGTNPAITFMLTRQGRMHHDIAAFANYCFYENKLHEVPLEHQQKLLPGSVGGVNGIDDIINTRRMAFVAVNAPEQQLADKVNQNEAEVIAAVVYRIYLKHKENFDASVTVGVIVPYRNQISTIRNILSREYNVPVLQDITIDTVERYQGSQRDYIIYGFTVSRYYQLDFLTSTSFMDYDGSEIDRKLNVALTRAMEHLIVVGNPYLLSNNITYYKLMEFARSVRGYFEVPVEKFVKGDFKVDKFEEENIDYGSACYALSETFAMAFDENVSAALKDKIDKDTFVNLNKIGFGREPLFLGKDNVLLYAWYNMRRRYKMAEVTYKECAGYLETHVSGKVTFIDMGSRTGECIIAFKESHAGECIGIESSVEMRLLAEKMLASAGISDYRIHDKFTSFSQMSGNGGTYIINMSCFFSDCSAAYAERLAWNIAYGMKQNRESRFIFVVQYPENDSQLNPYKVFRNIMGRHTENVAHKCTTFSFCNSGEEHTSTFCYDIFASGI